MRVLFVDDEPEILHALRRMLRPHTKDWDISFAESGPAALDLIDQSAVDVVVTDMRMPGMDGAALLTEVRSRQPGIVRIVLSGHTAEGMALRTAQVAHQFLTKPCDADHLKATIDRACALQDQLRSPVLRDVVGQLSSLPSPPKVALELREILNSSDPSLNEVAGLISTDPALSAKVLQLVNSAFFGLGQRLSSAREAVSYLGVNALSNLAVALGANEGFGNSEVSTGFLVGEQAHALRLSGMIRDLVPAGPGGHDAFVVGLLHDIGLLVFATALPDEHRAARTLAIEEHIHIAEAERTVFGATHAELGAYLLSLWGLPVEIVEAVAMHHRAPQLAARELDLVHATFIAETLDSRAQACARMGGARLAPLDPGYLAALGATEAVATVESRISSTGAEHR